MRLPEPIPPVRLLATLIALCLALFQAPVPAAEDYSAIDQHALNAPKEVEGSIDSLVAYLIKPARNEKEVLRALFRWITANIAYDTEGFYAALAAKTQTSDSSGTRSGETVEKLTPELVLKKRTAICDGYALLVESMVKQAVKQAGLLGNMSRTAAIFKIYDVKGFAKGYGYRAGADFNKSNHAWNAVNLDGEWSFMDCTWGSGLPNEKGEFVREFEDYYFMTPPAELVYTHFPDDPVWQRIDKPVSKSEFIELAYLWPAYFKYGMKLVSHSGSIVAAADRLEVSLYVPDSVIMEADLIRGRTPLDPHSTFIQRDSTEYRVMALFPQPGEYFLRLFTRRIAAEGAFKETLDYKIVASAGAPEAERFPEIYEAFHEHHAFIYTPLAGRLKPEQTQLFRIRVPGAASVSVTTGGERHLLEKAEEDIFSGEVETKPGPVEVYARFPGNLSYDCLAVYDCR